MPRKPLLTLLSTAALTAFAALSVPVTTVVAAPAQAAAKAKRTNNAYIVRLAEDPVVAYKGGIKGYAATKVIKGRKLDPTDSSVSRYKSYLESRHDATLGKVGGKKLYSYGYVFNGFAAELTEAQAAKLRATRGVLSVEKDALMHFDTATTPDFLRLVGENGFYNTTAVKGEDVIIGMVDSGVWPESLSFSDRTGANDIPAKKGKLSYNHIPGWHAKCTPGEQFNASHCNQKLIGARYYNAGWGGNAAIDQLFPFEFNSPRDWAGHGTHTASTAGGNANVPSTGPGAALGPVNGIAPRARIAVYKVCWADQPTGGGCWGSDSVAAIDQAVADGVDVMNFSIAGSRTNFRDAVEIAFMFAADAGVFVAASAGNSGPTVSTVAHPGPWLTTVAAGTHDRNGEGSVTLGNGVIVKGASFASAVGPLPLVRSKDVGLPGVDASKLALCYGESDGPAGHDNTPTLDPAKVAGKIVVCERGGNVLVNKSQAVMDAGGAGMVLLNTATSASSQLAITHVVPAVHVGPGAGEAEDYKAIDTYAATANATATINQARVVFNVPAPATANFSSRGPLLAGNGDLLKPDIIAPGQDIFAAVAPPNNAGRDFDLYSGTSMSSPHIAGIAALFKELNPTWSPMMIKSALMTTAGDILDGPNTNPLVIFRQGAGHVQPTSAIDPGLVFDSGFADWLGFLCGTQLPVSFCTDAGVPVLDPSDLNVASIAIGDLAGSQTVKRRVTNVGGKGQYSFKFSGLAGFDVDVVPSTFALNPGQSQDLAITITRTTAPLNAYTGGYLSWSDGSHNVRIPVVLRPVALSAPTAVSGTGGDISYNVTFGFTGPFTATGRGLVPAALTNGSVNQDPDQTFDPSDPTGTVAIPVVIPAGTTYQRYALFDADVTAGSDLDVFVYQGTTLVGSSTNGGSTEEINFSFANPTGGPIPLTVYIHGWGVAGGGSSPFKLHDWSVGAVAAGNMAVTAPAAATLGDTGTVTLSFSGLASGTKYMGSVVYGGAAGMPSPTIVRVDP